MFIPNYTISFRYTTFVVLDYLADLAILSQVILVHVQHLMPATTLPTSCRASTFLMRLHPPRTQVLLLFFAVKDRKQLSTQFHGTTSELRRATLVSMETLKVRYSRALALALNTIQPPVLNHASQQMSAQHQQRRQPDHTGDCESQGRTDYQ